jgi:hypothetical protein
MRSFLALLILVFGSFLGCHGRDEAPRRIQHLLALVPPTDLQVQRFSDGRSSFLGDGDTVIVAHIPTASRAQWQASMNQSGLWSSTPPLLAPRSKPAVLLPSPSPTVFFASFEKLYDPSGNLTRILTAAPATNYTVAAYDSSSGLLIVYDFDM